MKQRKSFTNWPPKNFRKFKNCGKNTVCRDYENSISDEKERCGFVIYFLHFSNLKFWKGEFKLAQHYNSYGVDIELWFYWIGGVSKDCRSSAVFGGFYVLECVSDKRHREESLLIFVDD